MAGPTEPDGFPSWPPLHTFHPAPPLPLWPRSPRTRVCKIISSNIIFQVFLSFFPLHINSSKILPYTTHKKGESLSFQYLSLPHPDDFNSFLPKERSNWQSEPPPLNSSVRKTTPNLLQPKKCLVLLVGSHRTWKATRWQGLCREGN